MFGKEESLNLKKFPYVLIKKGEKVPPGGKEKKKISSRKEQRGNRRALPSPTFLLNSKGGGLSSLRGGTSDGYPRGGKRRNGKVFVREKKRGSVCLTAAGKERFHGGCVREPGTAKEGEKKPIACPSRAKGRGKGCVVGGEGRY